MSALFQKLKPPEPEGKFGYPHVSETDLDIWLGGFHISPLWLYVPINLVVGNLRHLNLMFGLLGSHISPLRLYDPYWA